MLLDRDRPDDSADAALLREQRLTLAACALMASQGNAVEAFLAPRAGLVRDLRAIARVARVDAFIRRSGGCLVARFASGVPSNGPPGGPQGPRVV